MVLFFPFSFRTESVAEKMLTNWFAFLLHKFLKVGILTNQITRCGTCICFVHKCTYHLWVVFFLFLFFFLSRDL